MDKKRRTSLIGGALLIIVGGVLFAAQILPDFMPDFWEMISWPWAIIGVGLFLFALGAALGEPGLAVPSMIVPGLHRTLGKLVLSVDLNSRFCGPWYCTDESFGWKRGRFI